MKKVIGLGVVLSKSEQQKFKGMMDPIPPCSVVCYDSTYTELGECYTNNCNAPLTDCKSSWANSAYAGCGCTD